MERFLLLRSNAEDEYKEIMLKAQPLIDAIIKTANADSFKILADKII